MPRLSICRPGGVSAVGKPRDICEVRASFAADPAGWSVNLQHVLKRLSQLRLRYLFLVTFTLVAVLPAVTLTAWVVDHALTQERQSSGAKQQHLAGVVAFGLDRYANDVRAAFEHMASLDYGTFDKRATMRLARNLGFRYALLIGPDGGQIEFTDFEHGPEGRTDEELRARIVETAVQSPRFLPVITDGAGQPTVFITEAYQDGTVIAAALSTGHIRATQRAVSFGTHGHAVIVDQLGKVIAHPNAELETSVRSLSRIEAVQALLRQESGYQEFYSPVREETMLAGYAPAGVAGWGVMAVRPKAEIVSLAWEYAAGAIIFVAVALLAAMGLAFAMARVIVRPVERVAAVAQRLSSGDMSAQVDPVPQVPVELGNLSRTINSLAGNLNLWRLSLTESLEEAQASSREKHDFLSSLSHEIRSPLNVVIGLAEAMQDERLAGADAAKRSEYARDIATAGHHLLELIDGILELSRIGSGQVLPSPGPVSLTDSVGGVIRVMEPQARRENIALTCNLSADLPPVDANESKLSQVLLNLISNAIKFTPEGGQVTLSAEVLDNGRLAVYIADTGIGMSPRDLEIALKPFGRVQRAWNRGRSGIGLGLPLARQLAEEMGGGFAIDSTPGHGTTVTLTFETTSATNAA